MEVPFRLQATLARAKRSRPSDSPFVRLLADRCVNAHLEDLGRIGSRHETVRAFYVSVITALFTFLAMTGKDGVLQDMRGRIQALVGGVGILICTAWFFHMWSFAQIYKAKLATLRDMEQKLPFQPFQAESSSLGVHPIRITLLDRVVALVFVGLFVLLWLFKNL